MLWYVIVERGEVLGLKEYLDDLSEPAGRPSRSNAGKPRVQVFG